MGSCFRRTFFSEARSRFEFVDGSVEALLRVDPAPLSGEERLDHLERVHALAARVDAARDKALAALHDPDDQKRWVREKVGAASPPLRLLRSNPTN